MSNRDLARGAHRDTSVLTVSVLIPSWRRPDALHRCVAALQNQTHSPDEIIIVWQGDDLETFHAANALRNQRLVPILIVHSPQVGIVPAENVALSSASGDIVCLIDDDACPRPDWVEKHLNHYADERVGAAGGPARNVDVNGRPRPSRSHTEIGRIKLYGRLVGNMYDHPADWYNRGVIAVDHLAGNNMSIRRRAFSDFETGLKPYWQFFEAETCLQVRANGYRIVYDFSNVVDHHSRSGMYDGARDGDITPKIINAAYNQAFILGKHSGPFTASVRLAYLTFVGCRNAPGLLAFLACILQHRKFRREGHIFFKCLNAHWAGFKAGYARQSQLVHARSLA